MTAVAGGQNRERAFLHLGALQVSLDSDNGDEAITTTAAGTVGGTQGGDTGSFNFLIAH